MSILNFKKRAEERKLLITKLVRDYSTPVNKISPTTEEINDYQKSLNKLSLKKLHKLDGMKKYPIKLQIRDRVRSLKKKNYAVVTIFNDNKTTDFGVCNISNRSFSRDGKRYLIMPERAVYSPEFKMAHFFYYSNQVFPIDFQKPPNPENTPDGRLLDSTIENGVIEALANLDMSSLIKICMVVSVLNFIIGAFLLVLRLRGGNL